MMTKILNIALVLLILGLIASYIYRMPKYDEGVVAPVFEGLLKDGTSFDLDELKGNYVLLDFWGSWCGPCRQENPALVDLYNRFHQQGQQPNFHILSVAIETKEDSWLNAIEKDNLYWPHHIVQLQRFKSPIAQLYGVKEIPTKYLIDPQGKIIAVNPSFDAMITILDKVL